MFSLTYFQTKVHSQYFFHLGEIQKDVTVISDFDRRNQKDCFRERRGEIS